MVSQRCRYNMSRTEIWRRSGLIHLILSATAMVAFLLSATVVAKERPNIVIVLADDLGYGDLACYGHPTIRSPFIDRFASEGLRLTSCYSAAANCSPSRCGLMTGRTPYRVGIHNWIPMGSPMHVARSEITLATLLQKSGYATCHVGKWHLNGKFNTPHQPQPSDHGFDHWFSTQNNALPSHRNPENFVRNGKPVGPLQGYSAQLVTDEAIQWLRNIRAKQRPFFLFVCYHEPHEPIESAPEFRRSYPDTGPRSVYDPSSSSIAAHHGNVTQMDFHFGRLLKALDDDGLRDKTLVVFTSDNGPAITRTHPHGSAGPLREKKGHLYEGGIRVPGIIRWPGKTKPGAVSDTAISGVDWLPTLCAMTGVSVPQDRVLDGTDVSAVFSGLPVRRSQPLYWQFNVAASAPKVAMRQGRWKIVATLTPPVIKPYGDLRQGDQLAIKSAELDRFEIYDLEMDLAERNNVVASDSEIASKLKPEIQRLYRQVRDESPTWPAWKFPGIEGKRIRTYIEQRKTESTSKQNSP